MTKNERNHLPYIVQFPISSCGILENVVDGLGVRNPQTVLLFGEDVVNAQPMRVRSRTYPKRTIPTSDSSVVLQDALFNDASILDLPIPLVTLES